MSCFSAHLQRLPSQLIRLLLILFFLTSLTSCESRRTIVNGLEEKDANEILVFLASKNIDATKIQAASEGGGGARIVLWNISVPNAQANEAMALLNQVGLPRRPGKNLLGIFANVGLVPSGMEQKIRYQAGLAEQIANTIRKIDGVLDADVQISFPEEDPLNPGATKQKITASVYVKHSGVLDDPNAHLVTKIKRLVAGSVPGLDFDNVTVIGDRARFTEQPGYTLGTTDQEKPLVHVWTLTLAEESLSRFRIIFFSFITSLLILLLAALWLLWKFYPLLASLYHNGHMKEFLTDYHPVKLEDIGAPKEAPKTEEKPPEEAPKEDESTTAGKGIDET